VPVVISGGVHLATYGATRACGQAAAEIIAGTSVPHLSAQALAA
jgi:beta-N-acetylhexosaminidase